mgnify:CR=1 FL=1
MRISIYASLALTFIFIISNSFAADKNAGQQPSGKSNPTGQPCVSFDGSGAKKTFLVLYPFTQGKVTAIVTKSSKLGDTSILTDNIFCRVWTVNLPQNLDNALAELKKMEPAKFQCGYFISSEGDLTACSDPL